MSDASPRMRRILEIVYALDGVLGARVWEWPADDRTHVAVAVRPAPTTSALELLKRVEAGVAGLREPGEHWDFGLLDGND
jgi:hypothetical protein